ncbi:uncharacterized protein LOC112560131 [Pomacea canaliculata]|uniref:uncharacterized protein LOC112560131 n=1 Tax=Pomacea canaliculata TaxID=400727 RepID=UPI000D73AC65|nr:uncharacterized protein LOC112560131 [Pomacea canaliculata]
MFDFHHFAAMSISKVLLCRAVQLAMLFLCLVNESFGQQLDCKSCPDKEKTIPIAVLGEVRCSLGADQQLSAATPFCNFTQSCRKADARAWQQRTGYTEISGTGSDYSAYSTLQSPWMDVRQASCLSFDFAQTLPSKLAVVVNDTCVFRAPDKQLTQFQPGVVSLSPGNVTVEFRAYNLAQPDSWVRMRNVTVWAGACPEMATRPVPQDNAGNAALATTSTNIFVTTSLLFCLYLQLLN